MDSLVRKVIEWADERDLLHKENANRQMLKVMEELGETASALAKNNQDDIKDGIGDVMVTLIILSKQLGFTPYECLLRAWGDIYDRKGETINGIFVKEE